MALGVQLHHQTAWFNEFGEQIDGLVFSTAPEGATLAEGAGSSPDETEGFEGEITLWTTLEECFACCECDGVALNEDVVQGNGIADIDPPNVLPLPKVFEDDANVVVGLISDVEAVSVACTGLRPEANEPLPNVFPLPKVFAVDDGLDADDVAVVFPCTGLRSEAKEPLPKVFPLPNCFAEEGLGVEAGVVPNVCEGLKVEAAAIVVVLLGVSPVVTVDCG